MFTIGSKNFVLGKRTYIMGILNVTPDSFSDGGKFNNVEKAIAHAKKMIEQGADIIDVGGESTRPGHKPVDEKEEIRRVIPVIEALRKETDIPISIDTYKGSVAESAIKAGADLINDVWGFKKDTYMAKVAAKYQVSCCLMHNRENNNYENLMQDMIDDLQKSVEIALEAGVKKENIILDPGIGFAKDYEQNLIVMNNLEKLNKLGYPVLLGTSRKSMIGNTLNVPPEERVEGTIATTVIGIMKGCDFVRVHDVLENKRAAMMTDAIVRNR
ncbi:dihydropteroate synthase [Clostridium sp. JN-9]|uniref:dihydropteroate synthase n=1 Tax=Clostridium sp. JN-9 TaxID=2507159 RepID=UPI000FFE15DA|nr:dihydropteroate synthase [Clostridium sp. JN-9]QAT38813.1 dihydropteroate synthase [Clostridium sp. JN-9]